MLDRGEPTPFWERRFTLPTDTLSMRERDVLALLAEGSAREEVAVLLGISAHTVKTYQTKILLKLGARNTPHAVAIARRQGLLDPKEGCVDD